jgi:methionine synthase I (cobalamin-dependent)/5,10-methylenetetrahydrofolate reductase
MAAFLKLLDRQRPLLSDGAMGTVLHARGVSLDQCFDALNLSDPALIAEVHHEYIEAGANIIQTNTFGANRFKLARHGLDTRVAEINQAAVELAHRVVLASFKEVLVAGDVGPLGVRIAPFGRVQPEQAREVFREQIQALVAARVDLLIIETMSDLYEINEAIQAARQVAPDLPVVASMTFTRDDLTLLGDRPQKVANYLHQTGADVIGVNCSGGPNQLLRILKLMREAAPQARISVMPNAGWPEQVGGRIMYPAAPEYFGEYALSFCENGASLIGGCCGTTPQHIQAMARAIQSNQPGCAPEPGIVLTSPAEEALPGEGATELAARLAKGKFVVAVEMDPPRGLSTHKIIAGASLLSEAGADVVNVADSPMARMRMSPWAVCSLIQHRVGVETVLHFPTRGRNLLRVQGDLLAAHALGVRNVFVVMGDPTAIGDYPNAMDNYDLVPSGLIKLIKQNFNAGVDHAGTDIGQPTSFFVGCALNLNPPDPQAEIKNLKRKLKAGADFILTQPVYDPEQAMGFIRQIQQALAGPLPIPILAGILPLASGRHAAFLHHEVPGIDIPSAIRERMADSGEQGAKEGIRIASELVGQLQGVIQGVYIMPAFNRFDYAAEIIENVKAQAPG